MQDAILTWIDFKAQIIPKNYPLNYQKKFITGSTENFYYEVYATDKTSMSWVGRCYTQEELADFDDNYKSLCNKSTYDNEGKQYIRAESRPLECTTVFTSCGDSSTDIGNGKQLMWDFSNSDDIITAPTGFKRKRIDFNYLDTVYIKEGTIYFENVIRGSYFDQYIICPAGYYYYNNELQVVQATEDTLVAHYVIKQPLMGSASPGLQLQTETCSGAIPPYYIFRSEVTVPDTDILSYGVARVMLYRERTVIL